MKQRFKDHWYIAIALIAIFAAGNGFGFVFGTKTAKPASASASVEVASWSNSTLDSLSQSLNLTEEQRNEIRPQVEATAAKVIAARERTLLDYHVLLLALHDELSENLDSSQKERLEESKASLEKTIQTRFSSLLKDEK